MVDENFLSGQLDFVFSRINTVVIGPGLGRDEQDVENAIKLCKKVLDKIVIVDGVFLQFTTQDGINLLCSNRDIFKNTPLFLTPNAREAEKLLHHFNCKYVHLLIMPREPEQVLGHLPNAIIILKGKEDKLLAKNRVLTCNEVGSLKRTGGIGDILAGVIAAFSCKCKGQNNLFSAAFTACKVVRIASNMAYSEKIWATTAADVLSRLASPINKYLPN